MSRRQHNRRTYTSAYRLFAWPRLRPRSCYRHMTSEDVSYFALAAFRLRTPVSRVLQPASSPNFVRLQRCARCTHSERCHCERPRCLLACNETFCLLYAVGDVRLRNEGDHNPATIVEF